MFFVCLCYEKAWKPTRDFSFVSGMKSFSLIIFNIEMYDDEEMFEFVYVWEATESGTCARLLYQGLRALQAVFDT